MTMWETPMSNLNITELEMSNSFQLWQLDLASNLNNPKHLYDELACHPTDLWQWDEYGSKPDQCPGIRITLLDGIWMFIPQTYGITADG